MTKYPAPLDYSFLSTSTGEILIARSEKGIAAVMLADHQLTLTQALESRFASSHHRLLVDGLQTEKTLIKAIMHGESTADDLSLDLQGTGFQMTVWQALMCIPFATTVSYQQLAERAGYPKATRAVASACGANPIAIVVPCHRVIRKNTELGGYYWGLDKKRALLSLEQQVKQRQEIMTTMAG